MSLKIEVESFDYQEAIKAVQSLLDEAKEKDEISATEIVDIVIEKIIY